ncbi:MAG TPA: hypothetical protein VKX28_06570 [Xanthobacteraceae bacterium]|nr:hypothetical protein [Xanthobacteraceae bacterium]
MPDEKRPPLTTPSESNEIPGLPRQNSPASPVFPFVPFGTPVVPSGSPGPGQPGYSQELRRDIANAAKESSAVGGKATPQETVSTGADSKPKQDFWTHADKSMVALCELLALLFGLPFGDDLYHGTPITGWHWFYLAVAVLFAVGGPMWPWLRSRKGAAEAFTRAAAHPFAWLAVLLALFFYGVGPEMYRRATWQAPVAPPATLSAADAGTFGWAPISTGNVDWDALDRACSTGETPKLSVRADDGNVASLCDPNKKGWVAVCWHGDPRMKRGIAPWPTKENTPGLIGRCQGAEDWCAYKSPSISATEANRRQLEKYTAPATVYACTAVIKDEGAK